MLELINRARANPAAEGQRLVALAQSDPVIRQATAGWDLGLFDRTISAYAPEPPLAFNPRLIDAALVEDASMLALNSQQHSPTGFLNNPSVAVDSDGQAYLPTGSGSWATGENIFAFSGNVTSTSPTAVVDYFEAGFLLDWGNPDFGHLKNLLGPGPAEANPSAGVYPFNQIGVGLLTGTPTTPAASTGPNAGLNVGPELVTQEFGWRQGTAFLTGTFYNDTAGTHFEQPGEGIGGVTVSAIGTAGQGTFQTQTWASGGYSLQLPPGTYHVTATGGVPGAPSTVVTVGQDNVAWELGFNPTQPADIPVPADYDGIGRAEVATYQPSTGVWSIDSPTTGPRSVGFGMPGDIPVPGRYDGGTKVEIAVFRPTTGLWYIIAPNGLRVVAFGAPGDIPVTGDYDGDGKADVAVYRPSNGLWFIDGSRSGLQIKAFGMPGVDQPVPATYDGGGVTEVAVLRPTTYQWFILGPTGFRIVQFGAAGCIPVPAPYEGGGRAELALYQPSTSTFFDWNDGVKMTLGAANLDQPTPGDFDGDGKADFAVFQPTAAGWTIAGSRAGPIQLQYGQSGIAQTLKGLASLTVAVPPTWSTWVASPGAESAAGFGPNPVAVPIARRPIGWFATRRPTLVRIDRMTDDR